KKTRAQQGEPRSDAAGFPPYRQKKNSRRVTIQHLHAAIVGESSMARSSLYYHFGDKKGLFRRL
ncbi:MAG TPA: hypothetical protein VFS88_07115, partial [Micavibrio sp.]|nr:hypothetical protein [Micavibrio sp.]